MKILVIGANGRAGNACVKQLLKDNIQVRVLVRSVEKSKALVEMGCEAIIGDVFDKQKVTEAVNGVDGIASCLGTHRSTKTTKADYLKTGIQGNLNLIEIAELSTKLPHFVFISSLNAEKNTYFADFEAKSQIEKHLLSSKLPWTILKPSGYIDSLLDEFIQNGVVQYAGPFKQPANPIAAKDVGAAVAKVFLHSEIKGQTLELYGPERIGFIEAIKKWSQLSGKPLRYRNMPLGAFGVLARIMSPFMPIMPQIYQLQRSLNEFDWSGDPAVLTSLLDRPLTRIEDFVSSECK